MRWTEQHDILFCREILMVRPYQFKTGSKESGGAWSMISDDLNIIQELSFNTTQKSVRDRYRLLLDKYNKKNRQQLAASGSVETETELDQLLRNIKEESDTCLEEFEKISQEKQNKIDNEKKQAEDIRNKATWRLGMKQISIENLHHLIHHLMT